MKFILGLDLGQSQDYTALAILERLVPPARQEHMKNQWPFGGRLAPPTVSPRYHVRQLERFTLGTPYPSVVTKIKAVLDTPVLAGQSMLVVDATGVGAPVVDLLYAARLTVPLYAITITGGDAVASEGAHYRVPKRDLVSSVQVLLQTQRLKIAQELTEAQTLVNELLHFQVKINEQTAHDSYGVWREGQHDDLVLAVALACWAGEKIDGQNEVIIKNLDQLRQRTTPRTRQEWERWVVEWARQRRS